MQTIRIKILYHFDSPRSEERLRYVLHFLEHHPLSEGRIKFDDPENATVSICYHPDKTFAKADFYIPSQSLFFKENDPPTKDYQANEYLTEGRTVYSVEPQKKPPEPILKDGTFAFDLFETLFFHISRYEEWFCKKKKKDRWDMMKTPLQFLVRSKIHRIPVVDHLVFAFLQALGLNSEPLKTAFSISHDIDEVQNFSSIWKPIRRSGGLLLRKRNWSAHRRLWEAYREVMNGQSKDPFDTFDWMISPGEGKEKNIYFLAGGNTRYDTPFDLQTPRMQEIFALCKARNYIIGLHPSYAAWRDEKLFREEKSRLESLINVPVKKSRQHYLHFDFQKTPEILERQGIKRDSSLGFNDRIGFRCGTGFPYRLYNFNREEAFNFQEDPLVLMDSALLCEAGYDPQKVAEVWNSFLKENSHLTRINFNFHNSRFFDAWIHDIPLRKMYEQILT